MLTSKTTCTHGLMAGSWFWTSHIHRFSSSLYAWVSVPEQTKRVRHDTPQQGTPPTERGRKGGVCMKTTPHPQAWLMLFIVLRPIYLWVIVQQLFHWLKMSPDSLETKRQARRTTVVRLEQRKGWDKFRHLRTLVHGMVTMRYNQGAVSQQQYNNC